MLFDSQIASERLNSPQNLVKRFNQKVENDLPPFDALVKLESVSDTDNGNGNHDGRHRSSPDNNPFGVLTTPERALTAALAHVDKLKNVNAVTGVSMSQIENLKFGKTDHDGEVRPELVNATRHKLAEIRDVAMDKLLKSMGLIDDESLEELDAKDLSTVSVNMSKVVERTLPKETDGGARTTIVMYAPVQSSIEQFNVVEV